MNFETPLCRNSDAAHRAVIRFSRFTTRSFGTSVRIAAVDRMNARSRQSAEGEIIVDGKGWTGRTPEHGTRHEIAMFKRAFAEPAGICQCEAASTLDAMSV